jgi:hypothetical protein
VSNRLDTTDVTPVGTHELMLAMQYMIDTGRGLALLNGLANAELREVDQAIWDDLSGDPNRRVAVLLRFRALVVVFRARKLRELLLGRGFRLIAPAVHVAARMRLNTQWGFNPLKFERALRDLLAQLDDGAARSAEPLSA